MEHRYFPRHLENFKVTLKGKIGDAITTRVLDVSREGLRVSVSDSLIPPGAVVDVIMPRDKQSLFGSCCLRAFVAYATPGISGLWLIDVAKKFDETLADN
ncbi:hypothetical protein MNBD_GAMMA24-644 [hydrothermal vent metagenome]|uniref:PilZ domain-containing protein n=1 Tax=hydrothermal vent metagenome TaxID=652676 RepID=A0A3B1BC45_9ZZZZ